MAKCAQILGYEGEHNRKRCPEKCQGDSIYCTQHRMLKMASVLAMNVRPPSVNLSETRPWFRPRWHTRQDV